MKKITCFVTTIVAFCFVVCLAGCSSDNNEDNPNTKTIDTVHLYEPESLDGISFKVSGNWSHPVNVNPYESAAATTEYEVRNYDDELSLIIDIVTLPAGTYESASNVMKDREGISDLEYSKVRESSVSNNRYITYKYSCNYDGEPCEGAFAVFNGTNGQYVINVVGVNSSSDYCIEMVNTILETVDIDNSYVVSLEPEWHVSDTATEQDQDHPLPDFTTTVVGGDAKSVTIQCTYKPIAATDAAGYYYFDSVTVNSTAYRADDGTSNGFEGCPVITKIDDTQYDFFFGMVGFNLDQSKTITFSMVDGSELPDTIYISFHATSSTVNTSGSWDTDWLDGKFLTLRYD